MGYKSRSNFAPCQSLTDEEFNKIFKEEITVCYSNCVEQHAGICIDNNNNCPYRKSNTIVT